MSSICSVYRRKLGSHKCFFIIKKENLCQKGEGKGRGGKGEECYQRITLKHQSFEI
jgi:hypothetical protein